jgi:hypothetical protein
MQKMSEILLDLAERPLSQPAEKNCVLPREQGKTVGPPGGFWRFRVKLGAGGAAKKRMAMLRTPLSCPVATARLPLLARHDAKVSDEPRQRLKRNQKYILTPSTRDHRQRGQPRFRRPLAWTGSLANLGTSAKPQMFGPI